MPVIFILIIMRAFFCIILFLAIGSPSYSEVKGIISDGSKALLLINNVSYGEGMGNLRILEVEPDKPLHEAAKGVDNPLVTMELRDVELKDVLRALAQEYGINMIVDEAVKGKITVSIRDVLLWEALDSILRSKGYFYRKHDNGLVTVRPAGRTMLEEQNMLVKEFRLKYLKLSDKVVESISEMLSSKGRVTQVQTANSIIVKDIVLSIQRIAALLGHMDRKPRHIMIEARIVEVNTSFRRQLGINWGTAYTEDRVFGRLGALDSALSVNLPSTGGEGGLSLGFGLIVDKLTLDLQLYALEDSGAARILSTPKIMVLENEQAAISSGQELLVPISKTATVISSTPGTTTQKPVTFDAKLQLSVRPRVIDGNNISLAIDTKKEEFDYSKQIDGFPPKFTSSARTDLIVKSGETIAIGGIHKRSEVTEGRGVPFLSKLPLLGWFFKSKTRSDAQVELFIFLTPTIVEEAPGEKLQSLEHGAARDRAGDKRSKGHIQS